MGLLKHLLLWPVTAPNFLIEFSFRQIEGVVRQELTYDTPVKADLMELQLLLELGDIDDDEYIRREAELMLRLRHIREWRAQLGMGVAGGLVRVAGSGVADQQEMASDAAREAGVAREAGADAVEAAAPVTDGSGQPAGDRPPSRSADADGGGPRVADPGSAGIDVHFDWD
jgi:hypothetical protein